MRERPLIKDYLAFLELDDGTVARLDGESVQVLDAWPPDAEGIPVQSPQGEARLDGRLVTAVVIRDATPDRDEQPRLLLILDGEAVLAVVPTQLGTVLHTEALLTSPLVTPEHVLVSPAGEAMTLDELVIT